MVQLTRSFQLGGFILNSIAPHITAIIVTMVKHMTLISTLSSFYHLIVSLHLLQKDNLMFCLENIHPELSHILHIPIPILR